MHACGACFPFTFTNRNKHCENKELGVRLTSPPAGAVCYKHSTTRLRSRRSQRALIIAHAYELFIPRTADYIAKIFLTMGKYDNLKVKQLQKELAKRNARQTGKKKTLIKL